MQCYEASRNKKINSDESDTSDYTHPIYCPRNGSKTLALRRLLQVFARCVASSGKVTDEVVMEYIREQEGVEPGDGGEDFRVAPP